MPRATVNVSDTIDLNLKSCEGGVVKLRRLNYGELLERRDMIMGMEIEDAKTKGAAPKAQMTLANRKAAVYEFGRCIVEHNLTDENDAALNFKDPKTLDALDPRIGDEISQKLDELNQFEDSLGD